MAAAIDPPAMPLSAAWICAAARLPASRPVGLTLGEYLRRQARCRFVYGLNDCLLWTASWAWVRGHPDAAAPFRGRYATRDAASRIVRRGGGMLAMARAGARRAHLVEIDPANAVRGDIGLGFLGETAWPGEPAGLIRAGSYWAGLPAGGGVLLGEAEMVAAWRV
jgi:hypothetical protein